MSSLTGSGPLQVPLQVGGSMQCLPLLPGAYMWYVENINFKIIKGTMEGFHCEFPISLWSTTLLMPLH